MSVSTSVASEDAAAASAPIVGHWIDGAHVADATRTSPVFDPATGAVQRRVALADADTVDRAVRSARAAFGEWSRVPLARRTAILFGFRELLAARAGEVAALITSEHGKTLEDAAGRGPARTRGRRVRLRAESPAQGRVLRTDRDRRRLDELPPAARGGVGITPFNFPAMVPMWMFPIASRAGTRSC